MFSPVTQGDIDAVEALLRRKANAKDMVYYKDIRGAVGRELEVLSPVETWF